MIAEDYRYQFVAGNLALDFINTVASRLDPAKLKDHFQRTEDICRWANQAHLPDRAAIKSGPPLSRAALLRIRAIREQLFAVFSAIANDEPISNDALLRVGNALHQCRAKQSLSVQRAEVRWTWRPGAGSSDLLLYPILTAATDLLTSASRGLVRQCADEGCGWLFLDRSNARKRRWCSMADCGNRNKAREHYRRKAGLL
jgi:predicted RNA-binding Zn ribbon-like protein